jgi:NTP pyrophosphatase (non-canonical NTP hydrolase)
MQNYLEQSKRTISGEFHGDIIDRVEFLNTISNTIVDIAKLDRIKKLLFYGPDTAKGRVGVRKTPYDVSDLPNSVGNRNQRGDNIIHGIIGATTECAELLEILEKSFSHGSFDTVNMKEEVGDILWYIAILCREGGFTFEEAMETNIAKLQARYPDKFTEYDANNRNLPFEREILEQENGILNDKYGE